VALHRCVECGTASDCAPGKTCHAGHCAIPCTAATVATACALTPPPRCDDGICAQCDDSSGCATSPAGHVCLDGAKICVACKADAQCTAAGAPRCDVVTHKCVQCQANVDCPAATPLCDPSVGACRATP
jgi:hypothetical protein